MNIQQAVDMWEQADLDADNYENRQYPACIAVLDGVVAIADQDDNGSNLTMYRAADFVAWMKKAKRFASRNTGSMAEAIMETEPESEVYLSH